MTSVLSWTLTPNSCLIFFLPIAHFITSRPLSGPVLRFFTPAVSIKAMNSPMSHSVSSPLVATDHFSQLKLKFFLVQQIIYIKGSNSFISFNFASFTFNAALYGIQVDKSKILYLAYSDCLNNSDQTISWSASCFSLTNVQNLLIINLTVQNSFTSTSTCGLKIFYDYSYGFTQDPYVSY